MADFDIKPASSDASFRRYFRVFHHGASVIVMDAPPDKEDSRPFISVAQLFFAAGLNVPEIFQVDLDRGFLLITDLGEKLYLDELKANNVERLYGDALESLRVLQSECPCEVGELPLYDKALLMREMELFREWYLTKYLGMAITPDQHTILDNTFEFLCRSALSQPRVCVHRDYHSRNLVVTERKNPGILDFQDAVIGPVTYDLVSLLRDCYIAWPRAQVEEWVRDYMRRAVSSGILRVVNEQQFLAWFDLMGIQRHLKAIGIFARLNIRDGKPGYLQDIPRTLGYVLEISAGFEELAPLHALLTTELGENRQLAI